MSNLITSLDTASLFCSYSHAQWRGASEFLHSAYK